MTAFIDPSKLEEAISLATCLDDSLVDRQIPVSTCKMKVEDNSKM